MSNINKFDQMVKNNNINLNSIFSALSDATRRAMLLRLSKGSMSVKELAEPFSMSKPAVTKHLKVLERAGLLRREIIGRVHRCHLVAEPLNEVSEWINFYEQFWSKNFDNLDNMLGESTLKDECNVG